MEPTFLRSEVRRNAAVSLAALPTAVLVQLALLHLTGVANPSVSDSATWEVLIALLAVAMAQSTVSPIIQSLLLAGRSTAQLMLDAGRAGGLAVALACGWWSDASFATMVMLFGFVQVAYYLMAALVCGGVRRRKVALA
jgi:hypothetical protein